MLAFAPILFAGVVFAVSFTRAVEPDRAFGANIAGAMFGGLAEYSSMLLGFQYLLFVAVALYIVLDHRQSKGRDGKPAAHNGHDAAAWLGGAVYSTSAMFGTSRVTSASQRSTICTVPTTVPPARWTRSAHRLNVCPCCARRRQSAPSCHSSA